MLSLNALWNFIKLLQTTSSPIFNKSACNLLGSFWPYSYWLGALKTQVGPHPIAVQFGCHFQGLRVDSVHFQFWRASCYDPIHRSKLGINVCYHHLAQIVDVPDKIGTTCLTFGGFQPLHELTFPGIPTARRIIWKALDHIYGFVALKL